MRLLPEYSATQSILLALPYAGSDWDNNLQQALDCYQRMVKAFLSADKGVNVLILVHPNCHWKAWFSRLGLDDSERLRLKVIADIRYNDTWVRDYGPLTCVDEVCGAETISYKSFGFNGWGGKYPAGDDNNVALQLVRYGIAPLVKRPLILEGGALEINSQGVLLVNRDCIVDVARNPHMTELGIATVLHHELGAEDIEWVFGVSLTGDDTDGHIDTLARFISDERVVCSGRNTEHPDSGQLQKLYDQLQTICDARHWQLQELPTPIVRSTLDNRLLPATYANFLMCNQCVFSPVYGVPEDKSAITVLEKLLPDKQVVPVRCEALLEQHGSLHCATMQIG